MDRIKRLSYEVLDAHKSKFGEDFADNKKVLDQISIIRSKGLKNEVAGYITKFIKKEIREEKIKQAQNESQVEETVIPEEESTETVVETAPAEETSEPAIEETTEAVTESTPAEETSEPVEEKTE